jgi:Carboxypeptidase regulatory-like domain
MLHFCVCIAAFLALLFVSSTLISQVPTGVISGTVYDSTGAVIQHATVELRSQASGDKRIVTTNSAGFFSFPAILSGNYDIRISAPSFSTYVETGYHLDPGDSRSINDIHLSAHSVETVVVSAAAGLIDTTSGEMSSLITASDIEHLPVEGRDVTELFKMLPGFANAGQGISNTAYDPAQVTVGYGALASYTANGLPIPGMSLKWDGANLTDPGDYSGNTMNINYDMVSEVKVQTGNFTAEESNGPVVINAVSKTGGRQFHGSLYTYARTYQLNSTDWLANFEGYGKPPDRYVYPGMNIGGPVTIPGTKFNRNGRVTFFAGVEDYAQRNNYAYGAASQALIHALVPTAAMRAGDFSASSLENYLGKSFGSASYANITKVPTVDKNKNALVNGNIAGAIDPGSAALLGLLPLPNTPSNGVYNYISQNLISNDLWEALGRVDVAISDKYKLFARYVVERGSGGVPQVPYYSPQAPMGSVNTPGGGLLNTTNAQSGVVNLTMILSPTTTNEVFGSYDYLDSAFQPKTPGSQNKSTYGYPYAGAFPNNGSVEMPQLQDYGYDGLPLLLSSDFSYGPLFTKKFLPDAGDNFTKILGRHALKLGIYLEQVTNNQENANPGTPPNGAVAQYYNGSPTLTDVNKKVYYNSGNYLANAFEGIFGSYLQANGNPTINLYFWNIDGYVTDSWKVVRNVTLNFGLRVEHLGMWNDKDGVGLAIFDPTTLSQKANAVTRPLPGFRWHQTDPQVPVSGLTSRPAFYEPRFGLAWDVNSNGKTVVRAGYGQYRYHDPYNEAYNAANSATGIRSTSQSGSGGLTLAGIATLNLPQQGGTDNVTAYGLMPGDNNQALTQTYSLAIDRTLPYGIQFEVAYIGSASDNLLNTGSGVGVALSNVNILPYGANYATATPGVRLTPIQVGALTTVQSESHRKYGTNPYDPVSGLLVASPYGSVNNYGSLSVPQHVAYSNYNGIQVVVSRQTGPLRFGANYTFGKALGILGAVSGGNPVDDTNLLNNYGVTPFDRSQLFKVNYSYSVGSPVKNRWVGGFTNGWEFAGFTQIQSGQNLQVAQGTPNFSPLIYLSGPQYSTTGALVSETAGILMGTSDVTLMPTLICDPRSGLAKHEYINPNCFALGAQPAGQPITNGPNFYPYMHGPAYTASDLSAQKAFPLPREQQIQFRLAAFNFLNHPLPSFNSIRPNEYSSLYFSGTTPGSAVAQPLANSQAPGSQFGSLTLKQGRRVMEVSVKYNF